VLRPIGVIAGVAALLIAALVVASRGSPPPAPAATIAVPDPVRPESGTAPSAPVVSRLGMRRARKWARSRAGEVTFAVLDGSGLRGSGRHVQMPSASVTKAMLLVAVLRSQREITPAVRGLLEPMITRSDNDAADAVYAQVGGAGLAAVGRAAGMTHFADVGHWAAERITAADQARLFFALGRLVPARHRRYARSLLGGIIPQQSWGIAAVARAAGLRAWFKGGWRTDVVHQVALVESQGRRAAIAILTRGSPSFDYAVATVEGIARRLLMTPAARRAS
jgi:hypothetical protein